MQLCVRVDVVADILEPPWDGGPSHVCGGIWPKKTAISRVSPFAAAEELSLSVTLHTNSSWPDTISFLPQPSPREAPLPVLDVWCQSDKG